MSYLASPQYPQAAPLSSTKNARIAALVMKLNALNQACAISAGTLQDIADGKWDRICGKQT